MHKSFKIEKTDLDYLINRHESAFATLSDSSLDCFKKVEEDKLDDVIYQAANGKIDGDEIIKAYFPSMTPHVFISHSSKDKKTAIKFANYLFQKHGITSFIDSQIWGHIDHALEILNGKYSKLRKENNGSIIYSHRKANIISSNIYAMLNIALMKTMDGSDGLILISSENSVGGDGYDVEDLLANKYATESPWIYSEINFSKMLRPRMHERPQIYALDGTESFVSQEVRKDMMFESVSFVLRAELEHMVHVKRNDLMDIMKLNPRKHPLLNLDNIYHVLEAKILSHMQ